MFVRLVAFFLLVWRASTQTANIIPSSLNGIEGENLDVTCSLEGASRPDFELRVGGTPIQDTGKSRGGLETSTGTTFVYGPLSRTEVGLSFVCDSQIGFTASASLDVYCKFIVYFLQRHNNVYNATYQNASPLYSLTRGEVFNTRTMLSSSWSSSTVFMKFNTYWYVQYIQCL